MSRSTSYAAHMKTWLESETGERFQLIGPCSIGRLPENAIVFPEKKVSRRHALIYVSGRGAHWLVDLGSSNGVCLNGHRVLEPVPLRDGDRIEIGGHTLGFRQSRLQRGRPAPLTAADEATWMKTERISEMFAETGYGRIVLNG